MLAFSARPCRFARLRFEPLTNLMSARNDISRRTVLGALIFAPVVAAARAAPARPRMAMWVWKDRVLKPGELVSFADRHRITTLLVYVSPTAARALLAGEAEALASVKAMRGAGRQVYAMAGEPDWARGPSEMPEHAGLLVRLATTTKLFDGLHFDVEPNALPEWRTRDGRAALIEGTLTFYDLLRKAAPNVAIDAAVNPIFAVLPAGPETFMYAIAKRVSSLSIMAYRSRIARALDWATPAVEQIAAAGRPWRMGVLVTPNPSEPGTSWFGTPRATFIASMQELDRQILGLHPKSDYMGLVFEDYDGLLQMFSS